LEQHGIILKVKYTTIGAHVFLIPVLTIKKDIEDKVYLDDWAVHGMYIPL
jgi:hypothetical protein